MGYNGGYADIHAISFYKLSGDNNNRNIVVYLQNVEKETYTNNSDWVEFSDEDIVFEGEFNFGVAGEWVTITLPTPFEYTGGNLALTVYDKTGTGYGYDYTKCDKVASSSVAAWRGLYVTKAEVMDLSQLSAYYGTAMKTSSYETPANSYFVNNVKFRTMPIEGDPILDAPTGLAATANNHSSITLTWNAIEGANRYNVYSGTEKIASVKDAEYTYAGLEAETEYCFTVTAINSGGESEHSAEACATTEVFEGCNVNFTLTDQYNDGWDGCYLVVEYDGLTEQFNCPSGASPKTYTLPISHGSTVVVTYTKSSNYPQEKGIIVTYESGKEILNVAQGSLSATTSWEFVVDCTPAVPETPVLAAEVKGDKTIVLTMDAVGAESFNIYLNGELYIEGVTENVYGSFKELNMREVKVPEGFAKLAARSFSDCKNLQKIVLPESLQSIGYSAFYGASALRHLYIPSGVTDIGFCVFSDKTVTIYGEAGSAAYDYAEKYKLTFSEGIPS